MSENRIRTDICVIGAGSGGLSVAAGAVQMGARTVLIERGRMGGDCLNYGCVPSKSLLAAARTADAIRRADRFGIGAAEPAVDFARVNDHVRDVIAGIAPHDSVERFEGLGVRVIRDAARFIGPDCLTAGGVTVTARRFVLATGSRAAKPALPGLDEVPFLTNETLFELRTAPAHLIVIGGGPIGIEMAQAHRRLGCKVTLIQRSAILPKDDPELVGMVRHRLVADGIDLREQAEIRRVERLGSGVAVVLADGARIEGSHLLIAAGRHANVEDLGLEAAGIEYSDKGVRTDARLRTTNRRIFAVGDVAGGPQFTHVAGYHAGIVIRNALFRLPAKVDYRAMPWVTYTDPELANVGLTEQQAVSRGEPIRILRWPFHDNDRAQTERETEGLVKVIATKSGRVLGAGIVGAQAGELIQLWGLAIAKRLKLGDVASMIAPYPTRGEAGKRAAMSFYAPKLFSPFTRRIVRLLGRLG
jgi:pyruvate/2-oxoglutarate dehydrogenase complex dihydrolipoamide dehydrogenase (E3) component